MARRRHKNPKRYVKLTLIGAAIGAGLNVAYKYWHGPRGMQVYTGTQILADADLSNTLPSGVAVDTRDRSSYAMDGLWSGALFGAVAGMAYSGATK